MNIIKDIFSEWRLKLIFFASYAAFCSGPNYLALYYSQVYNLTNEEIGVIRSISPFISMLVLPIWTFISDTYSNPKTILQINLIFGSLSFLSHLMVTSQTENLKMLLIIINIVFALFWSSVGALLDAAALRVIDKAKYGQQRWVGSLSCGISSFITGLCISFSQDYKSPFYVFIAAVFFFGIFSSMFLSVNGKPPKYESLSKFNENPLKGDTVSIHDGENILKEPASLKSSDENNTKLEIVKTVSCKNDIENVSNVDSKSFIKDSLFFISIALIGVSFYTISSFYFVFLITEMNAPSSILGVITMATIAFEIPVFMISKKLLEVIGAPTMILLSYGIMALRFLLYILVPKVTNVAYFMIPIEFLHGPAFALIWAAYINTIESIAPLKYKATYLGLMYSMFNNIGQVLGSAFGGMIYTRFGSTYLWSFGLASTFASFLIFTFYRFITRK